MGVADYETGSEATADTQYRIGSITKTFTAVAVMQLRDEPACSTSTTASSSTCRGSRSAAPTIRRMLAHLSGLQREPGDMWVDRRRADARGELVAAHGPIELVLPPTVQHHYSNLAFALLGQVVARRSGERYLDYVGERIIRPLGLERTSWTPQPPKAQGYLVDEYARTVWLEPETDLGGTAAAGQLWSTVEDFDHGADANVQ